MLTQEPQQGGGVGLQLGLQTVFLAADRLAVFGELPARLFQAQQIGAMFPHPGIQFSQPVVGLYQLGMGFVQRFTFCLPVRLVGPSRRTSCKAPGFCKSR